MSILNIEDFLVQFALMGNWVIWSESRKRALNIWSKTKKKYMNARSDIEKTCHKLLCCRNITY